MSLSIKQRKFIRRIVIISIIILLVIIALPIKVPIKIKTRGKVVPRSAYRIIQNLPDGLKFELKHYLISDSDKMKIFNFDRGDVVDLDFVFGDNPDKLVQKDDSIVSIHSEQLEYKITELKGQLQQRKALLQSYKSGEKKAVIQKAREQLELQKIKAAEQKIIYRRIEKLYQSNLASKQEYEKAKNLLDIYQSEVRIAKSHLETLTSGEKPEQIEVINKEIKALDNQLEQLVNQKKKYTISSPLSGYAYTNSSVDTLLTIEDHSSAGVIFPVPLEKIAEVKVGQTVELLLPELRKRSSAKIIDIENTIMNMNTHQLITVTALLDSNNIPTGSVVKCKIQCGKESIYNKILKMFRSVEIN